MSIVFRTATSEEMRKVAKQFRVDVPASQNRNVGKLGMAIGWKLMRVMTNLGYAFMPKEKGVTFQKIKLNGVPAELSVPENCGNDNIILHIHGGGMVSGSARASRPYCSMLAKYSGCTVISVEYRLAPEHPYPAGLDDCYRAYEAILETYPGAKVALIGESAGGYYCMALLVRLINRQEKLPSSLVLNSPVLLLREGRDLSFGVTDQVVTESAIQTLIMAYAHGEDTSNPELSPILDDHAAQYPPIFLTCDANETLRADTQMLYEKCVQAGRKTQLVILENSFHASVTAGTMVPETKQLLEESCEFIQASFQ